MSDFQSGDLVTVRGRPGVWIVKSEAGEGSRLRIMRVLPNGNEGMTVGVGDTSLVLRPDLHVGRSDLRHQGYVATIIRQFAGDGGECVELEMPERAFNFRPDKHKRAYQGIRLKYPPNAATVSKDSFVAENIATFLQEANP